MYKLKRVCVVVMSLFVLVMLTACGKGAEGQLKGESFELVEESGDVLGDITFEDNGEYRVKDKDSFGGEGVGKYEVVSKGDKDYLLFKSVPDNAGDYFRDSLEKTNEENDAFIWALGDNKLISFEYDEFYQYSESLSEFDVSKIRLTSSIIEMKRK
ncbi:hypothetical protein [Mammaliicoccus sciuri]|uniref:Lipoprotein n=1 Tax=Mammaliicoccus sciuri TaxID=1296 RepID=A0AAI8DLE7_MAMSC|nr:hypothetical protein [Mammaliicoccus sciuri]ASE35695.1 hypothetical protein CEP64_13835 [Mammaliicoccus sciuri]